MQTATAQKYLASDKVKRVGSQKPLNVKKESINLHSEPAAQSSNAASTTPASRQPAVGPKSTGNAPMRKIGTDHFYKPGNAASAPSQAQQPQQKSTVAKAGHFARYQSPQMKLSQGGITAKQTQGVPVATQSQASAGGAQSASVSAGRMI